MRLSSSIQLLSLSLFYLSYVQSNIKIQQLSRDSIYQQVLYSYSIYQSTLWTHFLSTITFYIYLKFHILLDLLVLTERSRQVLNIGAEGGTWPETARRTLQFDTIFNALVLFYILFYINMIIWIHYEKQQKVSNRFDSEKMSSLIFVIFFKFALTCIWVLFLCWCAHFRYASCNIIDSDFMLNLSNWIVRVISWINIAEIILIVTFIIMTSSTLHNCLLMIISSLKIC